MALHGTDADRGAGYGVRHGSSGEHRARFDRVSDTFAGGERIGWRPHESGLVSGPESRLVQRSGRAVRVPLPQRRGVDVRRRLERSTLCRPAGTRRRPRPARRHSLDSGTRQRRRATASPIAAMVCGIVSVVLGWFPVVFAAGAVLAVLAIIFGIVGLRTGPPERPPARVRDRGSRHRCGRSPGRRRRPRVHGRRVPGDRPLREPARLDGLDRFLRGRGGTRPCRRRAPQRRYAVEPVHRLRRVPRAARRDTPSSAPHRCPRPRPAGPHSSWWTNASAAEFVECEITAVYGPAPFGLELD